MDSDAPTMPIVNDEAALRLMLAQMLADAGYATVEAHTGAKALAVLGKHAVQLILLDLHMPGQFDGEELLFELRNRGDEVPIIIVSGWVDDEAAAYPPDCVHAVLKKPIQRDHLLETVRLALDR